MSEQICEYCIFKSPAAQRLSSQELLRLSKNCTEVNFKKEEIIFKQESFSSNIAYLKHGLAKVHITGPKNEQIIRIAQAPAYLGIPTTINEKTNKYSATSIENTTVCFIDIETFRHFINHNGSFAYEIILELCQNEIYSFTKCVNRTQKQIHGRVAEALLMFLDEVYKSNEYELPLSRIEFGNFLDATRESVSRVLTEFNQDGLIEIKGRKIKILNQIMLEKVSRNG